MFKSCNFKTFATFKSLFFLSNNIKVITFILLFISGRKIMIRGLYTGATGMMMEMVRHDIIANNLANVNTAGYKRDVAVHKDFSKMFLERLNEPPIQISDRFQLFRETPVGNLGTGVVTDAIAVDFSSGGFQKTDNPLDLAINGNGFFAIETEKGIRYTRNGNFTLNSDGELSTPDGFRVLGQNGPIRVAGNNVDIGEDGVVNVDGKVVEQIQIIDFEDRRVLRKTGENLFAAPYDAPVLAGSGKVLQGGLEKANVDLAGEMVKMITALRAYEINQKAVQSQDSMLDQAINQVGKTNA